VKKLFVGNLPFATDEDRLREMFEEYGQVVSVTIPTDRETGRTRGFGFVEMETESQAQDALQGLDGYKEGGRALNVNEATPRQPRASKPRGDDQW